MSKSKLLYTDRLFLLHASTCVGLKQRITEEILRDKEFAKADYSFETYRVNQCPS